VRRAGADNSFCMERLLKMHAGFGARSRRMFPPM
jgi:hypothetical protein